jgi:protein tyrosine/serine phosphatase
MHSDEDEIKDAGEADGLRRERISFKTWHAEDEDVVKFLKIVTDKDKQPVFVHCQHGSDRTGTMCAVYRVAVQGWSKEDALREMREGGYGFHTIWQNLVDYFNAMDVGKLKKETGLK